MVMAADEFIAGGVRAKEWNKIRDEAKAKLLEALGDCTIGFLPDGRKIHRTTADFPAATIERKAYTSTTLTIQ
jgi:hypothetical protein